MSLKKEHLDELVEHFKWQITLHDPHSTKPSSEEKLCGRVADFVAHAARLGLEPNDIRRVTHAALHSFARHIILEVFSGELRDVSARVIREEMKKAALPARKTA